MSEITKEEWGILLTILGQEIEDLDDEISTYKYKVGKFELHEDAEREYQSNRTLRDGLIVLAQKIRDLIGTKK